MGLKNQYFLYNQTFRLRTDGDLDPEFWFHAATNSLTSTFFASGNRIPLFNQQLKLLTNQFIQLKLTVPDFLTNPRFRATLIGLINKNRILKGSQIRLLVFPSVRPTANPPAGIAYDHLAFVTESPVDHLPLNETGLHAGIVKVDPDGDHQYVSGCHARLQRLQMIHEARYRGLDLLLLKNQNFILPETSHGYLFMIGKNNLLAPLPDDRWRTSAIAGLVPELAHMAGLSFKTIGKTTEQSLTEADELFVVDDLIGFNWILALGKKRFFRKKVQMLSEILNSMLRSEDQLSIGSSG